MTPSDPERGATPPAGRHASDMKASYPSGSRIRRTTRLIGYNLLAAAVLLIPIEIGLRLFGFEFALKPAWVRALDPVVMERRYLVDPDMLWVPREHPARVATARDQRPSMVFMGDSCTHLGRYDERLQSIAEARNPGAGFTFVNLGVVGWSSWSGLQQLQRDVLPIRPKAITIYYGLNDQRPHLSLPDKDAAPFIKEPSVLRIAQLAHKAVIASRQFSSPYRVSPADFRDNLRRIVRIARDNGIIPILLTAPISSTPRRSTPPSLHRRYVEAVREAAEEEDAPLVDLHQEFNRLPRRDRDRLFWNDGVHLKSEGDRKIAELIDRHLVEADLYRRILIDSREGRAAATEAEERFQRTLDDARLLARGPFDVWLDGDRLLYVKEERCIALDEKFSLHVVPVDTDDLPEHRKEHGFDNLDFNLWQGRLGFTRRCAAARPLPDYPVASIRTGQFQFVGENGFNQLWEVEAIFTEAGD